LHTDTIVVHEGKHRASTESVAIHCGHRRHRKGEKPCHKEVERAVLNEREREREK
jgi:hypothetical protein